MGWRQPEPARQTTMPYLPVLMIACCAVFYYRLGESEYGSGWLLAVISVVMSVASWLLGYGIAGLLLAQGGMFLGLCFYNMRNAKRP